MANCAVLFGLHRMDAFPVDVWIKRALKDHLPEGFDPSSLGEYAGLRSSTCSLPSASGR